MRENATVQLNPEHFKTEILKELKAQIAELSKNFQPILPDEYLTRKEVAQLFKVSLQTVNNWRDRGVINGYGILESDRVYYKRSELEQAMIKIN